MDQNRNAQGRQDMSRDKTEGSRDQVRDDSNTSQPTGVGHQRERSSGGISNRDIDEQQEQWELPDRGTDRQSER